MTLLRELDLAYTEVGDHGLLLLAPLTRLTHLCLDSCRISNAGLAVLPKLAAPRVETAARPPWRQRPIRPPGFSGG